MIFRWGHATILHATAAMLKGIGRSFDEPFLTAPQAA
jgi:hypothetical protein